VEPGRWLNTRGLADDERTVAKTWKVALDELRQTKGATELLTLCAFLAPEDIPIELLGSGAELLPEPLREVARDPGALDQAMIAVRRYSFVTLVNDSLAVHRLVQAVTRHQLTKDQVSLWAASAVELVAKFSPKQAGDVRFWPVCGRLLPHALAAAEHAGEVKAAPERTSWLLDRAATYLRGRARLVEAREHSERALAISEAESGSDPRTLALRRNNLALVLNDLGDLKAARAQLERALAISEAAVGHDHPHVGTYRNNLGAVLQQLGDLKGARAQFERALAIDEASLGSDHPSTLTIRDNVVRVRQQLRGNRI
jgi:tetratricopeptide (TPR) repeat protein